MSCSEDNINRVWLISIVEVITYNGKKYHRYLKKDFEYTVFPSKEDVEPRGKDGGIPPDEASYSAMFDICTSYTSYPEEVSDIKIYMTTPPSLEGNKVYKIKEILNNK